MDIKPIKRTGHGLEGLGGNQGSLIDHPYVKLVQVVVHVPHNVLVDWNVEGSVDGFGLQICAKYGSVSLCEKGHWHCHEDL